ncbi:transposable element Tcb1 transposase [Trichonephila clavipes]|nr:transposable element Tcb1 transposase [Trichonephila clavipes]
MSQRVGRNQAIVMRICHRWMQKETTDRRGRSHLPCYTTTRNDRRIVCMAVMNRAAISRTTEHRTTVFSRTIQHRLHQSGMFAKHPLLHLPLTENHRPLHRQSTTEWYDIVFTDESRFCL